MDEEGLIARNVRQRMAAKGIGPKALSLKAGLNETYVRDLLKGRSRNPRQGHLRSLALALDCRVSDLTGETEREMLLRLAKSVRRDAEPEPPTVPTRRRTAACVVTVRRMSG